MVATKSARERAGSSPDPQRAVENPWLDRLARFGLLSRALVYAVVAALTIWIAIATRRGAPTGGHTVSGTGALHTLAEGATGPFVLYLLAAGFAGYAFFQVVDTVFHARKEQTTRERVGHRILSGWGVVLYGALAAYAVSLAGSPHRAADHASRAHHQHAELTARVMRDWWGGRVVVGAFGLVLVVSGLGLLRRAVTRNFRDRLARERMSPRAWRVAMTLGTVGCVGRALAIGLVGGFVVAAAVTFDPARAQGLDGTLRDVAASPYGLPVLVPLGVALVCYAGYAALEAVYRKV